MSLSPRPDRHTASTASGPSSRPSRSAPARACADSIAGMMPSVSAQQPQGLHRLVVGGRDVLGAADRGEPGVLGSDARVVQPCGDRVGLDGLAVLVLQDEGLRAVQHAGATAFDGCRVPRRVHAVAGRLDAVELDVGVVEEGVEHADRVRAAADARHDGVRKATDLLQELRPGLFADHLLEVAHHGGERMRSRGRAEDVVGRLDRGDPVAVGVVDRVLEGARARADGDHLGAEQAHAGDVERLALRVDLAHVDRAVEAEEGGRGRGRDAVLARAGLGDHARLAEALGQQRLAEHVVDLVRPGVVEVLALEEDPGATGVRGEPRHLGERGRPPRVGAQQLAGTPPGTRGRTSTSSYTAVSSSIAAISDSGMYRPPNSPKKGPVTSRRLLTSPLSDRSVHRRPPGTRRASRPGRP